MALTQDSIPNFRGPALADEMVIATGSQLYIGGLVAIDTTTGRAVPASAAADRRIAGYASFFKGPDQNGLGNTAGDERVVVKHQCELEVGVATAIRTSAALGLSVFVSDDETVGGTAVGTAGVQVAVGELVAFVDETGSDKSRGYVAVRRFAADKIGI